MSWFPLKSTGTLIILLVVVLVHGEWRIETKGQEEEGGIAVQQAKRRYKREWVKFARPCREEEDNSKRNPIAVISSDFQVKQEITYKISGMGIDQPPFGIFVVNQNTGEINITKIVDREKTPNFQIICRALNARGYDVEKPLILTVKILDINDNPPVFSQSIFMGEIEEKSASNTLVMILNATDADEPDSLNSKIAYKIISQEPADMPMFLLSRHTGEIHTLTNSLDRERFSSYRLIVSGADRDGDGTSTTCECSIKVKDVNDNFPIIKESQYSAQIKENTLSSDLLRFQVTDWDEEFTDNWNAVYFFTSGNEGKWFEIHTDPRTNEGILKVVKALDYEQLQSMQFGIAVRNKAAFHQSVSSQYIPHSTPVTIQVINVKEGITFQPGSKTFVVQKGISSSKLLNYALGAYQAIDEDTGKAATSVRYIMGRNDGGFLFIDSRTAQIKFIKNIDRDSIFIINKTITAEILAIDETTGKTSTGTVYVEVPGFSENCPTIVFAKTAICSSSPSVVVSAKSQDRDKYTGPYTFSLEEQPLKLPVEWRITTINATSALLTAHQQIALGKYKIPIIVTDSKNQICTVPEGLILEVCNCEDRDVCVDSWPKDNDNFEPIYGDRPRGRLGSEAIGLIFLGLLLLLLAPLLLLTCDCGKLGGVPGFVPVPDGSEGTIHPWGIEGAQPEDKEVTNICVPPVTASGNDFMETCDVCTNTYAGGTVIEGSSGTEICQKLVGAGGFVGPICSAGQSETIRTRFSTGGSHRDCADGAISMNFLHSYFSQKAQAYAEDDDGQEANDCLLIYDNEGEGPEEVPKDICDLSKDCLGCCTLITDDLDDSFLDSLGFKFKKLAEISLGVDDLDKHYQSLTKGSGLGKELCGNLPGIQQTGSDRCQLLPGCPAAPVLGSPCPVVQPAICIPDPCPVIQPAICIPDPCPVVQPAICIPDPCPVLQPAICIPDPLQGGNYLVTNACSTSKSLVFPSTTVCDPLLTKNVTVRERVICPISNNLGNLCASTEL